MVAPLAASARASTTMMPSSRAVAGCAYLSDADSPDTGSAGAIPVVYGRASGLEGVAVVVVESESVTTAGTRMLEVDDDGMAEVEGGETVVRVAALLVVVGLAVVVVGLGLAVVVVGLGLVVVRVLDT